MRQRLSFEGKNHKKKGGKIDRVFRDERDIFDFLKMQYREPVERTDGRAVIPKSADPDSFANQIVEEGKVEEGKVEEEKVEDDKEKDAAFAESEKAITGIQYF